MAVLAKCVNCGKEEYIARTVKQWACGPCLDKFWQTETLPMVEKAGGN